MAKSAAVTLAFLLAVFEIGSCLRCYQCSSVQDAGCADPFKSTKSLVDCSSPDSANYNTLYLRNVLRPEILASVAGAPRYCHKIITETGATIRTCLDGSPTDMNQTCRVMDNLSKMKYCSVCDKDNCNGATTSAISVPLATLAVIISYLLFKQ